MDCIFCKIIDGSIPSKKLYEDDQILAFYDIAPAADCHFLVISKAHISGVSALTQADGALLGHIFSTIAKLSGELGLASYRVVSNCGEAAGQTVFHLHFHVLSGPALGQMC